MIVEINCSGGGCSGSTVDMYIFRERSNFHKIATKSPVVLSVIDGFEGHTTST